MSVLLHIETATEICSVALSRGTTLLAARSATEHYSHASEITLLIQACLADAGLRTAQLDAVSVSSGPGSYTGLRIGASTAKGICYALDRPLIAINTLQALALASRLDNERALYCPMIDARRMEVYTAIYDTDQQLVTPTHALILDTSAFAKYFDAGHQLVFSGNGSTKAQALLEERDAVFTGIRCDAQHLIPLANEAFERQQFADLAYFSPDYHKPPNITKPRKLLGR